MRALLFLVALGTFVAGPAFAQCSSNAHHRVVNAAHQKPSRTVAPHAPDSYYQRPQLRDSDFPNIWTG
jgi:hypothetical protein